MDNPELATKEVISPSQKLLAVKVAFGTTAALGYSGSSGGCTAIIGESQGIYGSAPDVIITFE